jgi:cellulose synthase/poly-beta-1,6-N-acetylglucosamine synthase-like glycosyltransferase
MIQFLFWFSLGTILYTYLIYPFLIAVFALVFGKNPTSKDMYPKVSLVVSMYNESKVIADKIANSFGLNYPKDKIEIVLGSDGSIDKTAEIVKSYNDTRIKFYDFPVRRGKISVINDLIGKSTGEIIILSDANTILENNAVKELVSWFHDTSVGCVCGKLELKAADDGHNAEFEGIYWKYESFIKEQEGKLGCLLGANGGIYAIRKELFSPLPADTIIDDFLIPIRILYAGYKVYYNASALAYEETAKTIAQESIRKVRIGAGNYQAMVYACDLLNISHGLSSFVFWSHKVLRWFVPFLLIIVLLSNLLLIRQSFYLILFLLQLIFYLCVFTGFLIDKFRVSKFKIFVGFYYFYLMNLSLLLGFFNFLRGKQTAVWIRTDR